MKKRIFLCLTLAVVVLCGFTVSAAPGGFVEDLSSNPVPPTTTPSVSSDWYLELPEEYWPYFEPTRVVGDKILTFVPDGGMMMGGAPTVYYNYFPDKWPIPVRSGYVFGGWYLERTFISPVVDVMLGQPLNGNLTLYAKWTPAEQQSTSGVLGWFGNMSSSLFGWLQPVVDFIVSYPLIWIGMLVFVVCGGCIALFKRFKK